MPKGAAYPFPSTVEIVIGFLSVPVMLTGGAILIIGIANAFRGRDRWMWLLSCVMCLPLCIYFGNGIISQNNRNKSRSWPQLGMFLRDRLLEYHEAYPERFNYLGEDEEVEVKGFGDYVNTKRSEINPMLQSYVRVRTGKVLDPWGEPVRYGLDWNHNGYITIAGRNVITDHVSPPRLDYHLALVVILGHPDYGNGVGPQVAKK